MNATAVAMALNDADLKAALEYDGGHEILVAEPATIWNTEGSLTVTGVEIKTPYNLYHVYVDVKNGSVVFYRGQPEEASAPTEALDGITGSPQEDGGSPAGVNESAGR